MCTDFQVFTFSGSWYTVGWSSFKFITQVFLISNGTNDTVEENNKLGKLRINLNTRLVYR